LKKALLKRYQLTDRRRIPRDSKPDRGETVFQFVARLMRYFSMWIELSEIGGGLAYKRAVHPSVFEGLIFVPERAKT
jgi:hypothetical protein